MRPLNYFLLLVFLFINNFAFAQDNRERRIPLPVTLQQRTGETLTVTNRVENWKPEETAIIVCDMWDKHWCSKATARWVPLSEKIESVLNTARSNGIR
jgi:hypothetical protein